MALLVIFCVSLGRLDDSGDVANVVIAVVTTVGTVVVAFFGIHVAESGRRAAEDARRLAERRQEFHAQRVNDLAATDDPADKEEILARVFHEF